jgi:TetR/AcrR family transcriptional regulator, transcriptional repressor for nem operon
MMGGKSSGRLNFMRYSSDQKLKARRSIIESGAKVLKTGGFAGVGVDQVAAAAGVTSGSLYSNFSGKEDLLKEIIGQYLGAPYTDARAGDKVDWHARFREFLTGYISALHRDNPAAGCVMPALSADVSRASAAVRREYQQRMNELVDKVVKALKGGTRRQRRDRAWSIIALMVGSLTVARALPDGDEANEMVNAALKTAMDLLSQ